MPKKRFLPILTTVILASSAFALFPPSAYAITFDEIVSGVKSFIPGNDKVKSETTIDSSITLIPEGDVNKNGLIDAGDKIRFTYKIINTTDEDYPFGTIQTNIDRKKINFIHNVKGTVNLNDDGKTVTIPNFRISANQTANVSFDARVNYFITEDPSITTEAVFVNNSKKEIAKSQKREIKAKRIDKDKTPSMLLRKSKQENN